MPVFLECSPCMATKGESYKPLPFPPPSEIHLLQVRIRRKDDGLVRRSVVTCRVGNAILYSALNSREPDPAPQTLPDLVWLLGPPVFLFAFLHIEIVRRKPQPYYIVFLY